MAPDSLYFAVNYRTELDIIFVPIRVIVKFHLFLEFVTPLWRVTLFLIDLRQLLLYNFYEIFVTISSIDGSFDDCHDVTQISISEVNARRHQLVADVTRLDLLPAVVVFVQLGLHILVRCQLLGGFQVKNIIRAVRCHGEGRGELIALVNVVHYLFVVRAEIVASVWR